MKPFSSKLRRSCAVNREASIRVHCSPPVILCSVGAIRRAGAAGVGRRHRPSRAVSEPRPARRGDSAPQPLVEVAPHHHDGERGRPVVVHRVVRRQHRGAELSTPGIEHDRGRARRGARGRRGRVRARRGGHHLPQAVLVDLAAMRERKLIQDMDPRRDHIARQPRGEVTLISSSPTAAALPRPPDVRDQPLLVGRPHDLCHHHCVRGRRAGSRARARSRRARPGTADLHLAVDPADEVQVAFRVLADKVARPVEPRPQLGEWRLDEVLAVQLGAVEIAVPMPSRWCTAVRARRAALAASPDRGRSREFR